jgi:Tol biopolymer transport system component
MKPIFKLLSRMAIFLYFLSVLSCSDETEDDKNNGIDEAKVIAELNGEVIYVSDNKDLHKKNLGGLDIFLGKNTQTQPKWSADGSWIACLTLDLTNNVSTWYLKIYDQDGKELYNFLLGPTTTLGNLQGLSWSRDSKFVAVLATNRIYYVNATSGEINEVQMTVNPGFTYAAIAWNPSDNKIALAENYSTIWERKEVNYNIWVFDAYNTHPHDNPDNLIFSGKDQNISTVSYMDWSGDGSKIVCSGGSTYDYINIINADGSGNRKIKSRGMAPCWMSNNRQIIYTGVTNVVNTRLIFGLFVTDIDGSYDIDLKIKGMWPDCI